MTSAAKEILCESAHRQATLPRRLMRGLRSIVLVSGGAVNNRRPGRAVGSRIAAKLVRGQPSRLTALSFQQHTEKARGGTPIAPGLDEDVDHVSSSRYQLSPKRPRGIINLSEIRSEKADRLDRDPVFPGIFTRRSMALEGKTQQVDNAARTDHAGPCPQPCRVPDRSALDGGRCLGTLSAAAVRDSPRAVSG